jgi:hypothetical protein
VLCSYGASNGGKVSKEFVTTYLADVSKGAQMVFVDGVYNDELSDVSAIPSEIFAGSALSDKLTGQQKSDIDAVLVSAAYICIILLMLVQQNRVELNGPMQ